CRRKVWGMPGNYALLDTRMKLEVQDSQGKTHFFEAEGLDESTIDALSSQTYTRRQVRQMIDNMNVSADAKSLLNKIAETAIQVGERIIHIGKKILEYVIELVKSYPKATFGLILGLVLGGLVTAIPVIGFLFGWLLQPLLPALGLALGWKADINDSALKKRITDIQNSFSPLRGSEIPA